MVAQPKVDNRALPPNDWEGDDYTPGAGGAFVTCQDTAAGRMLYFATNGRKNLDGKVIRAAIKPPDSDGVSLRQVADAVYRLTSRTLIIPPWSVGQAESHLRLRKGLVVDGYYGAIPRAYRYQLNADFNHAVFFSHYSKTSGFRMWDPLNPDIHGFGRWVPTAVFRAFAYSLNDWGERFGYISLEPLV